MELTHLSLEWIIAGGASVLLYAIFLTWWLAGQFSKARQLIFDQLNILQKAILDKLEYHEKHDDQRFGQITSEIQARSTSIMNDIWAIKLRNAAIDARKDQKLEDCRTNAQTTGKT